MTVEIFHDQSPQKNVAKNCRNGTPDHQLVAHSTEPLRPALYNNLTSTLYQEKRNCCLLNLPTVSKRFIAFN